jgi:3-dehydroquinate dehydratase-2
MHGVNLDRLGQRDPDIYGGISLTELEVRVKRFAHDLGLEPAFSQTNHEGEFCEALHDAAETADGLILNPGAWTHYSYAIRDALEVSGLPAVEVHISSIETREEWRRHSVIRELCVGRVQGKGVEGYRDALELLKAELERQA